MSAVVIKVPDGMEQAHGKLGCRQVSHQDRPEGVDARPYGKRDEHADETPFEESGVVILQGQQQVGRGHYE